jgi:hypothetical protein
MTINDETGYFVVFVRDDSFLQELRKREVRKRHSRRDHLFRALGCNAG